MPTGALRRVARVSETPASAWGQALVTLDEGGAVLDAWFPSPSLGSPDGSDAPELSWHRFDLINSSYAVAAIRYPHPAPSRSCRRGLVSTREHLRRSCSLLSPTMARSLCSTRRRVQAT